MGNKLFRLFIPLTIILANVSILDQPRPGSDPTRKKCLPKFLNPSKMCFNSLRLGWKLREDLRRTVVRGMSQSRQKVTVSFTIFSSTPTYILTVMFLLFLSVIPSGYRRFFPKAGATHA